MRRVLLIFFAILIVIAIYEVGRHHTASPTAGSAGGSHAAAPGFSLPDLDGRSIELANYRGKVVLLDFWATWCAPCRDEIPHFVEFQSTYGGQGLQVIGLSMDDSAKPVLPFYKEFKMNYPVAMGTTQVAEAYGGILGLPVTFLIDRDGKIAAKHVGAVEMPVLEGEIKSALQAK
jgi:cytochrome c biogenesis protein CcmG/thiol:disulfide interchange protein DsbE